MMERHKFGKDAPNVPRKEAGATVSTEPWLQSRWMQVAADGTEPGVESGCLERDSQARIQSDTKVLGTRDTVHPANTQLRNFENQSGLIQFCAWL